MYKKAISALHVVNIVSQSIFTLLWQIALGVGIGYVAVTYWSAPKWVYIPLILAGVLTGIVSMVRFLLAAMNSLDRLEAQHKSDAKKRAQAKAKAESAGQDNKTENDT
ncbi:MAG: AtpZ/AtpI family protein [Clostridia bacterium]|nr:AtpZ/AtpI family protein [Clostridia bacterium]